MKRYLRLSCSICKRAADRLVDNSHVTPDKCTITLKCQGRLFPIEYRSDGDISAPPVTGISDWRPRDAKVVQSVVLASGGEFVNTSTGSLKQLVLAIAAPTAPLPGSSLVLSLDQRSDAPKQYRQYVFRSEVTFSTVSGIEAGIDKKTLRFTVTDTVEVYLNGIKLEVGLLPDNFQRYDGTASSAVPPNTIRFNKSIALPGVTQVDVIVSPQISTSTSSITLARNKHDESRVALGSWENVDYVKRLNGSTWQNLYLFTADLSSMTQLKLNSIMTASTSLRLNGVTSVPISDVLILLARAPYSNLDRYYNLAVPLSSLSFEQDYLKYSAVEGYPQLQVTASALATCYPLLRGTKFKAETTQKNALAGVSSQVVVDGSVIIGPDL